MPGLVGSGAWNVLGSNVSGSKKGRGAYNPDGSHRGGASPNHEYSPAGEHVWGRGEGEYSPLLGHDKRLGETQLPPEQGEDLERLSPYQVGGVYGISHRHATIAEAALKMGLLPWLLFLLASLWVMLLPVGDFMCGIVAVLCAIWAFRSAQDFYFERAAAFAACAVAVLCGWIAGYYLHYLYAFDYFAYEDHHQYTNVWPSEPAAAHQDASALVFAAETRPDMRLIGSFRAAYSTYCATPIAMDGVVEPDQGEIQYWAVGVDCCPRGKFFCGDARDLTARAGLVVYNRTFIGSKYMTNEVDLYAQAVRTVEAKYGTLSAKTPIFLHWAKDLDRARRGLLARAWLNWFKVGIATLPVWMILSPIAALKRAHRMSTKHERYRSRHA